MMDDRDDEESPIGAAGRVAARWADRLQRHPAPGAASRQRLPVIAPAGIGVLQRATGAPEGVDPGPGRREGGPHDADEPRVRPELVFLMPPAEPGGQSEEPPAAAGATKDASKTAPPAPPDARAVADRVYELMREEIFLARLRGGGSARRR